MLNTSDWTVLDSTTSESKNKTAKLINDRKGLEYDIAFNATFSNLDEQQRHQAIEELSEFINDQLENVFDQLPDTETIYLAVQRIQPTLQ